MTDDGELQQMKSAALFWARRDFPVLPVEPDGKKPLIRDWPNRATTDEEQIEQWWEDHPKANVGLLMGEEAGAVALDEDPRNDGDLDSLGPLPETLVHRTGGGGRHAFFQFHEALDRSRDLAPGVEVKSNGTFVVAPPSVHPSGDQYKVEQDASLAQPPGWLLNGAGGSERTEEGETSGQSNRIRTLIREGASEGSRNETISDIARFLARKGVPRDVAAALLEDWARTKCDPPYPSERDEKSVEDTVRTNYGTVRRRKEQEEYPEPEILRGDVLLEAGPPEKVAPLVPRFVWPGRITTLAGREKSGKSSLSAYITAAFTTGGEVLNRTVSHPGSVLWVTTPSEAAQIDPALDLQFFGGDPGRLYVLPEVRWRDDPIGEIHRAVETVKPDMVVVDSLSSIVTSLDLDLGSDSDWISVYQDLHSVAKGFRVGVLLVHHARRSDDRYRGSGGIGQSTDVLLELMEREEDQPRVRRIYPKGRARRLGSLELEPYKIQLTPDMDDYVYLGPISGSGDGPDQEILNYVRANDGCSTSDVQNQVDIRDSEVTKKLRSYEELGVLSSVDHGPGKATTWHFEEQTEMEGPFK